jgi:pimeloyl-ACP methyl ester carboxylesterase
MSDPTDAGAGRHPVEPGAWRHRIEHVNGVRIHCVEAGEGPLVLLVHGFPESWYSYRHQLGALAAAGYRAVAIDVRGYGRSSAPAPIEAYRMMMHVGDNVGLVHALGETQAVVVGHDWGAPIAWSSALVRPDVFRAVAGLSVPYSAPGDRKPSEVFRFMGGEEEFYIEYFQEPGRAEAEIEVDVRRWLLGFYFSASGDAPAREPGTGTMATVPRGRRLIERFSYPDTMPPWLTDEAFEVYVAEFERTGFTGGLNRYRNVDRDWEDLSVLRGRAIEVPALFIGGDRDGPTIWGKPAIDRFAETLPRLTKSVVLPGCGHWTQQERADEVSALLVEFLRHLDRA